MNIGLEAGNAQAADDHWSVFAFSGTWVSAFAVDPSNSARLFAATLAESGNFFKPSVFRSTDGGRTWIEADSGLPFSAAFYPLLVDPLDPSVLITGGDGIFITRDMGLTWGPLDLLTNDGCLYPIPLAVDRSGNLYVAEVPRLASGAECAALFKLSIDTSSQQTLPLKNATFVLADRRDPELLYATTSSSPGIARSADGGMSWSPFAGRSQHFATQLTEARDSTHLFAVELDGSVWESEKNTPSWIELVSHVGTLGFVSVLEDPFRPGVLYGVGFDSITYDRHVLRSLDGGIHWALFEAGLPVPLLPDVILSIPPDGNRLYAATKTGVFAVDLRPDRTRIRPVKQRPIDLVNGR